MSFKKWIAVILTLCTVFLAFSGCNPEEVNTVPSGNDGADSASAAPDGSVETVPEDTSFTVTDMTGREITFDAPAERVVALTASDCEILYAIGAGDAVIGRGAYCDYPEEILSKPEVMSGQETNIEEIIALNPQAVILAVMAQSESQVSALEDAGIKCVVSDAQNIDEVYTSVEMISKIVGKEAEGAALIDGMKSAFADIESKSDGDGSKTVYFEVSSLQWGDPWTAGSGTFMHEIASMLKLTNIFADVSGWAQISQEQVIERNPDFIVTVEMYFGDGPTPEEEIMGRDGWQNIKAVADGAVFNADSNQISRPGPRLADAANSLYEFVYGAE